MRIRKKRASHVRLFDLWKLWCGLGLLLLTIGYAVDLMNECVAIEVRAHPVYTSVPGLDVLPAAAREKLLAELNHRYCTCGCLMTLAACRNHHMSCRTSKRLGQQIMESVRGKL